VHDLAAARVHAFPALYPAAAAGLPTLADPGYYASAISQPGRKSYPAGRPLPGSTTRSGGTDSRPTAAAHREIRVGRPIRVGLLQAGVRVGPAAAAEHDGVQHAGADAEPAGDQLVAPAQALRAGVVPQRPGAEHLEHGQVGAVADSSRSVRRQRCQYLPSPGCRTGPTIPP
jgi:hypothetical protein